MADVGGLRDLAAIVRQRNAIDGEIAEMIGRAALIGNIGELSTLSKGSAVDLDCA